MKKINNDITTSTIVSKQNSPISVLTQEKFSSHLNDNIEESTELTQTASEVDIFMQSLQNKAQLNRMIIEALS